MAKLNLNDYELIASNKPIISKPLNMDDYEVVKEPEGPLTLKVPFTDLKYDVGQTPIIGKPLENFATGFSGVMSRTTAGIEKGLTAGAIDPERGTIGIPIVQNIFPKTRLQVLSPQDSMAKQMEEQGVSKTIAENPYVGLPGEFVGATVPIGIISRGVSAGLGAAGNLINKGTELAQIGAKIPAVSKAAQIGGRLLNAGITGGIYNTTNDAETGIIPGKSMINNVINGSVYGVGLQILGEGVGAIGNAVKLGQKFKAFQDTKNTLAEWAYGEGQYNTIDEAKQDIGSMLQNDIKQAGGLKNVTIEQAQKMQDFIKSKSQVEPVNVTPDNTIPFSDNPTVQNEANRIQNEVMAERPPISNEPIQSMTPENKTAAMTAIENTVNKAKGEPVPSTPQTIENVVQNELGTLIPKEGILNQAVNDQGMKQIDQIKNGQSIPYYRNLEKAPNMGSRFGQDIEPKGEYIGFNDNPNLDFKLPNYEYGDISFKNPLVVEYKSTGYGGWKTDLSQKYNGLINKELTATIKKDGYDGIVTYDKDTGNVREIVNLGGVKSEVKKKSGLINEPSPTETVSVSKEQYQPSKESGFVPSGNVMAEDNKLIQLNAGLPLKKFGNPRQVEMQVNDSADISPTLGKIVSSEPSKPSAKMIIHRFYQKLFDNQHSISQFTKDAHIGTAKDNPAIMSSNSRSTPGTVNYILKDALVTKEGKEIGKSFKSVIDQVPKKYEQQFNDYLLHRHNIARMEQEKPVFGKEVTPEMSQQQIAKYEKRYPEFKKIADQYDQFMQNFMGEWGNKSGLISDELWNQLKERYPHYTPTYRAQEEAAKVNAFAPKKGFVGQSNPIKKATGSEKNILNPLETSMQLVDKTVKAAKYNEVGQTIVNAIRKDPEGTKHWAEIVQEPKENLLADINKVLEEDGIEGVIQQFNDQFDHQFNKKPTGKNIVRVMEKGNPVYLKINDVDFLESVTGLIDFKPGAAEKIGRTITGPFKALITGKNPIFGTRNLPRDIPTAYINGSVKNPFKFVDNLRSAAAEMASNHEMFREYKALGGGQSGFFKEGKLDKLYKSSGLITTYNESIESLPRYAEYRATVLRGGNTYEAKMQGIFNANELTVNFSRHGNVVKAFDAWVPYLNPAVQGLDKLTRQVIKHPFLTVGKGVLAITVPQVALNLINQNNPNYQQLDNRTKDTYYLLPNALGEKDEKGNAKTFIKIPKAREYGVMFADTFDRISRAMRGNKHAFDGFANTVITNFAPTNPLENNILSPVITNLPSNKDFAGRTIVPQGMQRLSPKYQYDENTSEVSKLIGDKLNISPKQADYLIKSYTGVIGQFLLPATTKSGMKDVRGAASNVVSRNFISDPLYSNDIVNTFYDNKTKLDTKKADAKTLGKQFVGKEYGLQRAFTKVSNDISDLYKQIKGAKTESEKRVLRQKILDRAKRLNDLYSK